MSTVRRHQHKHNVPNRYEFIKVLGRGTYGKVKLARHKETNQLVAVKIIQKDKVKDSTDMRHIRREMEIMSSINHQHIIQIYEVFENEDRIIIVMEYAAGGELYDYLASKTNISDDEAKSLFRQIVSAIRYCHKQGIVHRDIKLENILLDKDRRIKIADFGLANSFKSDSFLHTFCGSPLYASPEIVRGISYQGPEVDSWSLGVLLYALVYGKMPFVGRNYQILTKQIVSGNYNKPPKQSGAQPLIKWLLNVDPKKRATIDDVAEHPWVKPIPSETNEDQSIVILDANSNHTTINSSVEIISHLDKRQIQTPTKSFIKQKTFEISKPSSEPATPCAEETLAQKLAAVCGFTTGKSSALLGKRNVLRSKRDRESGYYSSAERLRHMKRDAVSVSEPFLSTIRDEGPYFNRCTHTADRCSWPSGGEHCSSLPIQKTRHRMTKNSVNSDDGGSVSGRVRPDSDLSVLTSDSFDVICSDSVQASSTPVIGMTKSIDIPQNFSLVPDNHTTSLIPSQQAPGSLTPKSEKLVRELERILAPSGRRRRKHNTYYFENDMNYTKVDRPVNKYYFENDINPIKASSPISHIHPKFQNNIDPCVNF